jgi:hypothetical protein
MGTVNDRALVSEVARQVVRQTAPEELPLFSATAAAYFERADRASRPLDDRDDMLGFGEAVDLTMVTPVALAVASAVVQLVATEIAKATAKRAAEAATDSVAAFFQGLRTSSKTEPGTASAATPTLTAAQLAEVRQVAFDKACQLKLPIAQADVLADGVVGTLAVPQS